MNKEIKDSTRLHNEKYKFVTDGYCKWNEKLASQLCNAIDYGYSLGVSEERKRSAKLLDALGNIMVTEQPGYKRCEIAYKAIKEYEASDE